MDIETWITLPCRVFEVCKKDSSCKIGGKGTFLIGENKSVSIHPSRINVLNREKGKSLTGKENCKF